MKKKTFQKKKGFSLIEVMLATFLVTTGLVAVMALLSVGVRETSNSKEQLVASFLAQEGVELARNQRDTNWLSGAESFSGFATDGNYKVDAYSGISPENSDFGLNFYQNLYRHTNNGTPTKFSRKIEISGNSEQRVITSWVIWKEDFPSDISDCSLLNRCVYSRINLTKWREE
ncbi:MAG: type IV pilus modification PilV family protein [Patescibacteria group bacterium]